jgi:tetratricopeptide (TPR) repeat protein
MPVKTMTLAHLYEAQGHKEDALKIYKKILETDPDNHKVRVSIKRLEGKRKQFSNVNHEMLNFFTVMDSEAEYAEFERWLLFDK